MADTTTELEVLDEIVDVLGGTSGQHETVVPVLEDIRDLLSGGGGGGGGYNPSLSVGRADALTGADSTAQWATRESTGSGAATVRSVQGATEVQDGELVPVQIAGIASTDANGDALDGVEWETQTLRAAGSVADMLYSDHVDVRVGVVVLTGGVNLVEVTGSGTYTNARIAVSGFDGATAGGITSDQFTNNPTAGWKGLTAGQIRATSSGFWIGLSADVSTISLANAWLAEHQPIVFYELATPTTTPISPALPMTYRVEQGGTESIIAPDGEVSAAPVLTIAEGESAAELVMDALACIAAPDGPVATSSHAVNTYLTMQGKLYKVTSAIAVGETIKSGTNVSQTTVMAELIARTA